MPYTLTNSIDLSIKKYHIDQINIDMITNMCMVTLSQLDANGVAIPELPNVEFGFDLFDDFGNIIEPSAWSIENPSGNVMYGLIKSYCYMSLQDHNILEEGDIS